MQILYLILIIVLTNSSIYPQDLKHETMALNIEVPVRVFKGDTFIENLSIDDFEVYEDGRLQKIEAVYLIKKTTIERRHGEQKFTPQTERNFYLLFEVMDYSPRLREALHFFIHNVLTRGDNLVIVTPIKTYRLKSQVFDKLPKGEVVRQLVGILRKDALGGSAEYRNIVEELTRLAKALTTTLGGESGLNNQTEVSILEQDEDTRLEHLLSLYSAAIEKLERLREVDQKRLLDFGKQLKELEGPKHVFLFYQREFIPRIEPRILTQALGANQDKPHVLGNITSLMSSYTRNISIDVNKIKQSYSDSSIAVHFMFFTKPPDTVPGVHFEERSEDIFQPFLEIAKATGGSVINSADPEFLFQKAVAASENYYLVYYSPADDRLDGKFRNIVVRVKGKNYRIMHRAGYIAQLSK